MRARRRGMSLVEAMLAALLIGLCLAVFLSVTSGGLRESTRSRSQLMADQMVLNTSDEILGSRFGDTHHWWGDGTAVKGSWSKSPTTQKVSIKAVLEGRVNQMDFYRRVECAETQGGTGAFFGRGDADYDVVKISLFWEEATGTSSRGTAKSKVCYVTVWRRFGGI